MQASPSAPHFFTALLLLVVAAILVFTLWPFDFSQAAGPAFKWQTNLHDVLTNIALFLPFGFLLRLARLEKPRRLFLPELAWGALLSLFIETTQLYLASRHSQYSDVVCNAAGAWIGAWLGHLTGTWLRRGGEENPGACATLPLYGLLLLTPTVWLERLSGASFPPALMFLALCGTLTVSLFMACLREERPSLPPANAVLLAIGWILVAFFPYLEKTPAPVLWSCLLLGPLSYLALRRLSDREARVDPSLAARLRRILALLVLLHLGAGLVQSAGGEFSSWRWNLATFPIPPATRDYGASLVSQTMLFLLIGYFHGSDPLARGSSSLVRAALRASLLPLALLLLLTGWLPRPVLSLAELPLFSLAFVYGVLLDELRRKAGAQPMAEPPWPQPLEQE